MGKWNLDDVAWRRLEAVNVSFTRAILAPDFVISAPDFVILVQDFAISAPDFVISAI